MCLCVMCLGGVRFIMCLCVMCLGGARFIYVFMCYVLGSGEVHLFVMCYVLEHITRQHITYSKMLCVINHHKVHIF
jgi:hypothetical protein